MLLFSQVYSEMGQESTDIRLSSSSENGSWLERHQLALCSGLTAPRGTQHQFICTKIRGI